MNNSGVIELTGKLTVVTLLIIFLVILFLLFLHFYAKWFYYRHQEESFTTTTTTTTRRVRRRRFDFAEDSIEEGTAATGLDPSVLKSIPKIVFDPRNSKVGIECAVCLSDLAAGEEARMLPKCNHGFHVDCIDMWFQSHSTCPICRNPVSIPTQLPESSTEGRFPTNVLFYGDQTEICRVGVLSLEEDDRRANCFPSQQSICSSSSLTAQSLVIDIPPKADGDEEETKLPATKTPRSRPMKRLLSRDKRLNLCSNDTEQTDHTHS